jgi:hypothetical protein
MKPILCFSLFCAVGLWADEDQERAAIDKVIVALNDPVQRTGLLARDVDSGVDFDRLIDLHRKDSWSAGTVIGMHEPWTELTVPRVVSGRIRFLTSDAAMVYGASVVRGAVTLVPRVPLLFVMKRRGTDWRVSAVRVPIPHTILLP